MHVSNQQNRRKIAKWLCIDNLTYSCLNLLDIGHSTNHSGNYASFELSYQKTYHNSSSWRFLGQKKSQLRPTRVVHQFMNETPTVQRKTARISMDDTFRRQPATIRCIVTINSCKKCVIFEHKHTVLSNGLHDSSALRATASARAPSRPRRIFIFKSNYNYCLQSVIAAAETVINYSISAVVQTN